MKRSPNIVLITVDCLGAKYIEKAKKTYKFFSKGTVFENAFAVAPWTPPSFKSMFQSVYPTMLQGYMKLSNKIPTFVEVLSQNGYYTVGISQTPWLSRFFGYNRGFKLFRDFDIHNSMYLKIMKKIYHGFVNKYPKLWALYYLLSRYFISGCDTNVNKLVYKYLDVYQKEGEKRPLFLWIHYMSLHDPSIPSKNYVENFSIFKLMKMLEKYKKYTNSGRIDVDGMLTTNDLDEFKKLYELSLTEVDDIIMELLEILDNSLSLDETIIILTADHGQEFGEHGMFTHGIHLYDELIKVPLMVRSPQSRDNVNRVSTLVSLIDLAPTILEMASCRKPILYQGKSLYHLLTGEANQHRSYVVSEEGKDTIVVSFVNYKFSKDRIKLAIRTESWKYIYNTLTGKEELYYLPADPEEKNNLCKEAGDIASKFRNVRDRHLCRISDFDNLVLGSTKIGN